MLDSVSALGCALKQPIPKGEQWLLDLPGPYELTDRLCFEKGLPELYDHVADFYTRHGKHKRRGLTLEQFCDVVMSLTNFVWWPSVENVEELLERQRKKALRAAA